MTGDRSELDEELLTRFHGKGWRRLYHAAVYSGFATISLAIAASFATDYDWPAAVEWTLIVGFWVALVVAIVSTTPLAITYFKARRAVKAGSKTNQAN